MGCDIHMYMERRLPRGARRWAIERSVICDFCHGATEHGDGRPCFICDGKGAMPRSDPRVYRTRNYMTFALLANVRNSGDMPSWWPDRGVPNDASAWYANMAKGVDWHSHSYFTMAEYYDKLASVVEIPQEGFVDSLGFKEIQDRGAPTQWYEKDVTRFEELTVVSVDAIAARIAVEGAGDPGLSGRDYAPPDRGGPAPLQENGKPIYVKHVFALETLRVLQSLHHALEINTRAMCETLGPENVRLVFFFDN